MNLQGINSEIYQQFRNEVSEKRRKKSDKFYFIEDSYRSICAELLLQFCLYEVSGNYMPIELSYNDFGKPYMKNRVFLYNISHSGDWVVLAYGEREVGIDVEKVKDRMDEIAEMCFTEQEKEYVYAVENRERNERITEIWTLKESYLKYKGTGLTTELQHFSVNKTDGTVINQMGKVEKKLIFKTWGLEDEYYLSICAEKEEISVCKIDIEELNIFVSAKRTSRDN